jgi:hypothetical protein
MDKLMITCCALLLMHLGFALLALQMERHWEPSKIGQPYPSSPVLRRMKAAGCLLLVAAYALCVQQTGISMGSVLACMLCSAAAMSVALLLTWWPAWLYTYIRIVLWLRNVYKIVYR